MDPFSFAQRRDEYLKLQVNTLKRLRLAQRITIHTSTTRPLLIVRLCAWILHKSGCYLAVDIIDTHKN